MNLCLIVPLAGDKPEYTTRMPRVFNFAPDGTLLCIKSVEGLEISKFNHIYFTILQKHDEQYSVSELLRMQFSRKGWQNAEVVVLETPTKSQPETVYETISKMHINEAIMIKDGDGYFTCDFTLQNGIVIYPLDQLEMVNPHNKSYVAVDDQYYITNIIEKKIISRYFNAGGYLFESTFEYCKCYEDLKDHGKLYLSHIVYAMLLGGHSFRPFFCSEYEDWGE